MTAQPCRTPVLIIGTERSGSNLLRLILNAHSEITVPHPPHIVSYFSPLEPLYGDLTEQRNFERLVDHVATHVRRHIHPWPSPLDREALLRDAQPKDALGLYLAINDQHLAATGKKIWGCKSTFMIHHARRVLSERPSARFLWLVRDPRDVALSSRRSVFNPYHPYYTARLWAHQQQLGLALAQECGERTMLRVHYENLIREPEPTVRQICAFIGVPFEPAVLEYFRTRDARLTARLSQDWRHTARPIMSDNSDKFLKGLGGSEICVVEALAGCVMQKLGYTRVTAPSAGAAFGRYQTARFRAENEWLRLRTECRSLFVDRNHWRRWGRYWRINGLALWLRFTAPRREVH